MFKSLTLLLFALLVLTSCNQQEPAQQIRVILIADGRERTFQLPTATTVEEFLRDPRVDIDWGELDQINPPLFTQITDGMQITIARVAERSECVQEEIPFAQRVELNEGLQPGEQRVVQPGENGILEICYRVTLVDSIPRDRIEANRTEIEPARDEILYVGPTDEVEPVVITGTIAYISNGNAWIMQGSSTTKRPITTESDLDSKVFRLSEDGRRLLFTRGTTDDTNQSFNQLWFIADVSFPTEARSLVLENILYADWIPGLENTLTYSRGEPRTTAPRFLALNDLWQMRIDPQTGESVNLEQVLDRSTRGLYSWWGTRFQWSPDGSKLAWAQADSVGLVNFEENSLADPLRRYAVLRPTGDWSWRATLSWSSDSSYLITTVHGAPVGGESPENSPAFDVAVVDTNGVFSADMIDNSGIWSSPQFSPILETTTADFSDGYIAYFQARDPFNTINGEYDLIVADRDGSNARIIFPGEGQAGIAGQQSIFHSYEFAWSPDGRQIALIYQGNLWIVEVATGVTHQLTVDGAASSPIWTR
jgi:resuscitation-promoting factor RpfB